MRKEKAALYVTFRTKVGPSQGRFQVGRDIAKALGLGKRDYVDLVIRDADTGKLIYAGKAQFISNHEVYGGELEKRLKPGQRIFVEASSP